MLCVDKIRRRAERPRAYSTRLVPCFPSLPSPTRHPQLLLGQLRLVHVTRARARLDLGPLVLGRLTAVVGRLVRNPDRRLWLVQQQPVDQFDALHHRMVRVRDLVLPDGGWPQSE